MKKNNFKLITKNRNDFYYKNDSDPLMSENQVKALKILTSEEIEKKRGQFKRDLESNVGNETALRKAMEDFFEFDVDIE